ncbi:MAG: hypothetical protein Q9221_003346 [Calogaya cf. arnoldii]
MPSRKGPDPLDHGNISFKIHSNNYKSPPCRAWKKQNNAHLEEATPRAIPSHAHQLKRQLDDVYRSSRGRESVPRKMLKHFSESFDDLYEKLLPNTAGDTIAAAAVHERGEAQPDKKRSRRIDAFRAELPRPFNERRDIDPTLAIFVPVDDGGAVAVLRDLPADRILEKLREAVHETQWWFMEDGFVAWIIAVRQLPGGDIEVFVDTAEHRDLLQEHSAWEVVFMERLKQESCRALIQQFFDWNQPRMLYLRRIEDIVSIETRPTNYGRPIVVVNFSTPGIANEFINKWIQWGATEYQGRRCSKKYWPIEKKVKLSHLNQKASSPEPKPKPVGESRAEQDETHREGRVVIADKSDDQDQHTAHNNNEIPSTGVTESGEDDIATIRMLEQEQHLFHINNEVPPTDAAKLDIASREDIDGSLEQDQHTIHIKVKLPSPIDAAEPGNHDVGTIEQPNEAPEQDKHAVDICLENPSADAAMHDVATMEYLDRSLEQNQNINTELRSASYAAHINTELRSAGATGAEKHDITTENVAGTTEQDQSGANPVAKEPEDDPASDPMVQNVMRLLHGGSSPDVEQYQRETTTQKEGRSRRRKLKAKATQDISKIHNAETEVAGDAEKGDDAGAPPALESNQDESLIDQSQYTTRDSYKDPLIQKHPGAVSAATQSEQNSTIDQKISDIMKLFQVGSIPGPAPLEVKNTMTNTTIGPYEPREQGTEVLHRQKLDANEVLPSKAERQTTYEHQPRHTQELHKQKAKAKIVEATKKGDQIEEISALETNEAAITRFNVSNDIAPEIIELRAPLPIKTPQEVSTTTRSEGDSVPNQQVYNSAKLLQVDSSPDSASVNEKRKETEKEELARKLLELETEIAYLQESIPDIQGLGKKRRQIRRMQDMLKGEAKRESKKKAAAAGKEKEEGSVLPATKKTIAYMQGAIADNQGLTKKERKKNSKKKAAETETTAGAKEKCTGFRAKDCKEADNTALDTLPTVHTKTYESESTKVDDQQAHINHSNEPKMMEPMAPLPTTLPQVQQHNIAHFLQNSCIDEATAVPQQPPEIRTPYAPMASSVLPPLLRRFQARAPKT